MLIDYQSKRRDVCIAAQRWRCDVVMAWRIFCWEGEPQWKAQKQPVYLYTEATYVCTLKLRLKLWHLHPAQPLPPVRHIIILYGISLHGAATEPYTPYEAYDEPFIPHSTQQPRLTRAVFRLPLYL